MDEFLVTVVAAEGLTLAKVRAAKAGMRAKTANHARWRPIYVACEVTQEMLQNARKWGDVHAYGLPREVVYALDIIYREHDGRRLYLKNNAGNIGYEVTK